VNSSEAYRAAFAAYLLLAREEDDEGLEAFREHAYAESERLRKKERMA
jgi:hypothetical protein